MNRAPVLFSLLLGSLLLSGCGTQAGDSCSGSGYLCASEKEALECRDKVWRALPCKGPAGCSVSAQSINCDMTGNVDGDACAASAEGRGLCTADRKAVLECRMGTLVQVKTCSACTMSGDLVTCNP
ncbi:hypothetical protein [Vitiosangium sp. GDMCC 1.1324]|uniref:hypothetical protein n=1 Tax=Vitiosangium sp. (strain GDMCC 1.1324) TaxID=2138576 RepID=UPI000D3943EC|nr:hypothetical protein [Vitiosangium sp. GDMCC 1.1324]PTL77295.1 hypothetical protein DAT35_45530 [Vitiosangium sp. GDMCC 1.1324]